MYYGYQCIMDIRGLSVDRVLSRIHRQKIFHEKLRPHCLAYFHGKNHANFRKILLPSWGNYGVLSGTFNENSMGYSSAENQSWLSAKSNMDNAKSDVFFPAIDPKTASLGISLIAGLNPVGSNPH